MAGRVRRQLDIFASAGVPARSTACAICGRPLSDPESIATGIGPVCRQSHPTRQETTMPQANYTVRVDRGVIVIVDLNAPGSRSVTNDAERVIATLGAQGYDLTLPVIYKDSDGRWDGLEVKRGEFTGNFYALSPMGSTDYELARARLSERLAARASIERAGGLSPEVAALFPEVKGSATA